MEENTTIDTTNMEEMEDTVETIEEEQIVEDTSILKKKPKKPRTQKQMEAFKKCQDARKLKLKNKSVVQKQEPVKNKPVKKKQVKKTYIDLNEMSSSEDEQEIVYVKKKKRKPRKVVKYISSSESDEEEEYPVLNTSQEKYDCNLNDYYRFVG